MVNSNVIEIAGDFIKQIPKELGVKKSYLFGSYAKGTQREESDIDIAVVLGNMHDFFEVQMLLMRLRRKIDLRIEPHPIKEQDFNNSNPFAYEITTTGIELNLH
jgi:predicted nucleotidyltransferase